MSIIPKDLARDSGKGMVFPIVATEAGDGSVEKFRECCDDLSKPTLRAASGLSHQAQPIAVPRLGPAMFSLAPVSVNFRDDTLRFLAYPKAYQRKQNDFWKASASDRACRIACRLAFAMLPAEIKRLCRSPRVWRRDGSGNSDIAALRCVRNFDVPTGTSNAERAAASTVHAAAVHRPDCVRPRADSATRWPA